MLRRDHGLIHEALQAQPLCEGPQLCLEIGGTGRKTVSVQPKEKTEGSPGKGGRKSTRAGETEQDSSPEKPERQLRKQGRGGQEQPQRTPRGAGLSPWAASSGAVKTGSQALRAAQASTSPPAVLKTDSLRRWSCPWGHRLYLLTLSLQSRRPKSTERRAIPAWMRKPGERRAGSD